MTKAELLKRIASDPIVIEPIAKLACYRVSLHGAPNRMNGVILDVGPGGTCSVEDYDHAYARVNGKAIRLTYREAELVAARLRGILGEGPVPRLTRDAGATRTGRLWAVAPSRSHR